MATETIEVTGHIVDSLLLAKILDTILDAGCDYEIADVSDRQDQPRPEPSARIEVTGDDDVLGPLLDELQVHGANRVDQSDATPRAPPTATACCPPASTRPPTSPPTCGSTARGCPSRTPRWTAASWCADGRARTVPMHRVAGRRPGRGGQRRACGSQAPAHAAGHPAVRVHGVRGVVREAQGAARRPGGRAAAGRTRPGRQGAGRVRPGGRPHRRRPRPGPARRGRLGRRAVRRQRLRHPRHRVRTCSARRSACRWPRARPPRAATPTTSGSSTRCGGTARSPPPSTPAS